MPSLSRQKQVNNSKTYSNRSYKTNQDSNLICSTCRSQKEDMQLQISQLKDKAHQSFMQVLQIQQLHQEQINQLKDQWNERQQGLIAEISALQEQLQVLKGEMKQLQKNVNRHSYDFQEKQLVIENIELIGCGDNERSYLDESALMQFKDLLGAKNGTDYIASLRRQIYKDFKFVSNNKMQIEKLFMIINELKEQNAQLQKVNLSFEGKLAKKQALVSQLKVNLQNFNKENKFISQNLKRLSNDKLKLEKRVSMLEKAKMQDQTPLSPTLRRQVSAMNKEQTSEKVQQANLELSELSILKRQINQLNYAKFMMPEQIEKEGNSIGFEKKSKARINQRKEYS